MINKIDADIKSAMLSGQQMRVSVLKLAKSALVNKRIELKKDLTDEDFQAVLRTEVKKRHEAAVMYRQGGNNEAADKELAELEILEEYLPKQMTDDELAILIKEVKSELGDVHVGQIMQECIKRAQGRADGKRISAIVMKK